MENGTEFISDLSVKNLFSKKSLFRRYQEHFLRRHAPDFTGQIVEIGGELHYGHAKLFTAASGYQCTNLARDYEAYLDLTDTSIPAESLDNILCTSVVEHISDIEVALRQLVRLLKPGGRILLTAPFAFPHHDARDYWRLSKDTYRTRFSELETLALTHLGGTLSTVAEALSRPRGKWGLRYSLYKGLAVFITTFFGFLDQQDQFPLGYGLYAVKKTASN